MRAQPAVVSLQAELDILVADSLGVLDITSMRLFLHILLLFVGHFCIFKPKKKKKATP